MQVTLKSQSDLKLGRKKNNGHSLLLLLIQTRKVERPKNPTLKAHIGQFSLLCYTEIVITEFQSHNEKEIIMSKPRSTLINLENTEYYHCITRCVRRAFLCGEDLHTKQNYDHRRQWIVDRMKLLAQNFTIGICAYAVLSNHWHLVLKVDQSQAFNLTEDEVIARWTAIYPSGLIVVKRYLEGKASADEVEDVKSKIAIWRERLTNISWFMSALNHNIACRANKEDDCTGRFWESRFTSQALLDDTAILSCMAYVDLNPIRAGIAQELIDSDFTSIQERIVSFQTSQASGCK